MENNIWLLPESNILLNVVNDFLKENPSKNYTQEQFKNNLEEFVTCNRNFIAAVNFDWKYKEQYNFDLVERSNTSNFISVIDELVKKPENSYDLNVVITYLLFNMNNKSLDVARIKESDLSESTRGMYDVSKVDKTELFFL
ncbi:hypothetical protein [Ferruginibacter sp.]|nr:hypothetical protein [Ferruginibacter sp.]